MRHAFIRIAALERVCSVDNKLNHFDAKGQAVMVNVSEKQVTDRVAIAKGSISMRPETLKVIKEGKSKKGDVLAVARLAGIMGAKKTFDIIPLCHPVSLEHCSVEFEIIDEKCEIEAICKTELHGKTGVEMEALTGVSAALLTIYDMCKAIDRGMEINSISVHLKSGGKSGEYRRDEV